MRFVVTGGAGFIGSHIVRQILEQGGEVTVIDNMSAGNSDRLADLRDHIDVRITDVSDFKELEKTMRDSDGIFHNAALTSVHESFEKRDEYERVNVMGTRNVFSIAREHGTKVVFASSSSVYGSSGSVPIKENSPPKECTQPVCAIKDRKRERCRRICQRSGLVCHRPEIF